VSKRKFYSTHKVTLTEDEKAHIYRIIDSAFEKVKNINKKSDQDLEGEVFTKIRTDVIRASDVPYNIRHLFKGTMKSFSLCFSYLNKQTQMELRSMFNSIKEKRKSNSEKESINFTDLYMEMHIMRANIKRMEDLADQAKKVSEQAEELEKFIEG